MIRIDGVRLATQPPDMRAGIKAVQARVANVFGAAPPKPPACLSTNAPIAWKCRCRPSTCR